MFRLDYVRIFPGAFGFPVPDVPDVPNVVEPSYLSNSVLYTFWSLKKSNISSYVFYAVSLLSRPSSKLRLLPLFGDLELFLEFVADSGFG